MGLACSSGRREGNQQLGLLKLRNATAAFVRDGARRELARRRVSRAATRRGRRSLEEREEVRMVRGMLCSIRAAAPMKRQRQRWPCWHKRVGGVLEPDGGEPEESLSLSRSLSHTHTHTHTHRVSWTHASINRPRALANLSCCRTDPTYPCSTTSGSAQFLCHFSLLRVNLYYRAPLL